MKKNFSKLFSLLLSFILAFQVWLGAYPPVLAEGAGESPPSDELSEEQLDEYVNRFVDISENADGTSTAVFNFAPIRYRDDDGSWQDIDNTIMPNADLSDRQNGFLYTNSSAEVDVNLAADSSGDLLASVQHSGKSISFKPVIYDNSMSASSGALEQAGTGAAVFVYTPDEAQKQNAAHADRFVADRKYAALRYENVFSPGTHIELTPMSSGLKENIILSAPASGSFTYELSLDGMYPELNDDGSIFLYDDETDELCGFIAAPCMEDNAQSPAESYDIDVSLTEDDGKYIYRITPDEEWLNSTERVYPVAIDPTFTFNTETYLSDTFIAKKYPANCYVSDTHIKLGNSGTLGVSRGLFRLKSFSSALGSGRTIISASFKAYQDYTGASAPEIGLYNVSETYTYNTVTWNTAPACGSLIKKITVDDTGWFTWDVTSKIKSWYKTAPTVTALYMRNVSESANMYKRFRSVNYSDTAYAPKLTVVYMTKPANVKVSPTGWTNGSITVTHSTQSVSGNTITYQYALSTSNTTAPTSFTDFSNPSAASHSLSLATGSKYVWVRAKASSGAHSGATCSTTPYKVDKNAPIIGTATVSVGEQPDSYVVSWSNVDEKRSGLKSIEVKVGDADYVTAATGSTAVSGSYTFTSSSQSVPTVTLRATDNVGNKQTKTASFGAPSLTAAPIVGGVKLNWTPAEGAQYTLYRKNAQGDFDAIAQNLTISGYVDRDVRADETYTYRMKSTLGETSEFSTSSAAQPVSPAQEASAVGSKTHGELMGADISDGSAAVHALTGNLEFSKTDTSVNTAGSSISLTRFYDSRSLAYPWKSSLDVFLAKEYEDGQESAIYWADGSGEYHKFQKSGEIYTAPSDLRATLTPTEQGYSITLKDGTVYAFDQSGALLSITDRLGKVTQYIYNEAKMLTAVKNEYGCFIALEYDDNLRLSRAMAGSDYSAFLASDSYECYSIYEYTYDANGMLSSILAPNAGTEIYVYESGKLSKFTDAQAYDDIQEHLASQTPFEGREPINEFAYDSAGKVTSITDTMTGKTVFTYAQSSATAKTYEDMNNADVYSTDVYSYDNSGRLSSLSKNGRTTSYTYTNKGEVASVTDPDGKTSNYVYDANGNITSYSDRAGMTTQYTYDTGMISPKTVTEKKNDAVLKTTHYTYNADGLPTSAYTAGTRTKTFTEYIASGTNRGKISREISVTGSDPQNPITQNTAFSESMLTSPAYYATVMTYTYDDMGNQTSGANGSLVTTSAYGQNGLQTSSSDGRLTTSYTYNAMGDATENIQSTGSASRTQSTGYDKLGNVTSSTDAMNYTTSTKYNNMNEEIKSTSPTSIVTQTVYGIGTFMNQSHRYMLQTTASSSEYLTVYNEHGDVILAGNVWLSSSLKPETKSDGTNTVSVLMGFTIGENNTKYLLTHTYTNYDSMGRVTSTSNEAGDSTSYVYDDAGNVKEESVITGNTKTTTFTDYDNYGRVTSTHTDKFTRESESASFGTSPQHSGVTTTYTYDIQGRVLSETLSQGENSLTTNTFTYDTVSDGMLKSTTTDAKDRITERFTNALGQLVKERYLVKNSNGNYVEKYYTLYGYDNYGNMTSAIRKEGGVDPQTAQTVSTTYLYDGYGRQTTINYGTHKAVFTYDANDNVLTASRVSADGTVENTISYTYYNDGNVKTVTRNGETIRYDYNANGNLSNLYYAGVTATAGFEPAANLNPSGDVAEHNASVLLSGYTTKSFVRKHYFTNGEMNNLLEYRNSSDYIFRTFTYDDEGRITSKFDGNRSYTWDEKQFIYYDDEGRITSERNEGYYGDSTETPSNSTHKTYTYDWLGRVATETVDGVTTTFAYDAVGNLTSKTTGDLTTTYKINELDQVTEVKTNDSVIQATYTYDLSGNRTTKYSYGATTTYTYDGQNNLTSIMGTQANTSTYTYDANGDRLTKLNQTHTTQYYYYDTNLLFTKRNGQIDVRYLYDDGAVYCAVYNDIPYWYNTDIRGSVTNILKGDATSSITTSLNKSYVYDAYGNTGVTSTSEFSNAVAYTGAIFDEETGLYYLMSRYYDPAIAQFISEDSYRGDGEHFWNLYMYCEGDPVNNVDRDGHKARRLTKAQKNYLLKDYYYKIGTGKNVQNGAAKKFKETAATKQNCYGYAINVNGNIEPGFRFNKKIEKNSKKIAKAVIEDVYDLGRWARIISGKTAAILPDEYRIAVAIGYESANANVDFHFIV